MLGTQHPIGPPVHLNPNQNPMQYNNVNYQQPNYNLKNQPLNLTHKKIG